MPGTGPVNTLPLDGNNDSSNITITHGETSGSVLFKIR